MAELSRRSELTEGQLRSQLKNCQTNRQSRYFCAFREVVAADLSLRFAVDAKIREAPTCEGPLSHAVADFQKSRMRLCNESAADLLSEASIEPIAQARCIAGSTNAMAEQVRRGARCDLGVARR